MGASRTVPVRPAVLRWAMDEAGVGTAELAAHLKVPPSLVTEWLEGVSKPGTTPFRKIAAYLKLSTNTLLLPRPPDTGVPPAYRHPPGTAEGRTITREESDGVRQARRVQTVAHWVRDRAQEDSRVEVPQAEALSNPVALAERLQEWSGWTVAHQTSARDPYEAIRTFREFLEDRGLLVLQLRLGKDGCRGFSLADDIAPVIAASRRYIPQARLFTFVHELAHLATGTETLCASDSFAASQLERWCEEVAGSFLLPRQVVAEYIQETFDRDNVTEPSQVSRVARHFRLSQRGTAYRLQRTGLGSDDLFSKVASDLPQPRDDDQGPRERKAVKQYRELGPSYSELLLHAEQRRLLSHHDLLDYLDLPAAQLPEWRDLARGEPAGA